MPVKNKKRSHHVSHKKEKRNKHFLKVYSPYIPILLIFALSIFNFSPFLKKDVGEIMGYASSIGDLDLLLETNKMREREGLAPLAFNSKLDRAAQQKAMDMAERNYWSHDTPDGKKPWIFIEDESYSYLKAAENLAYGFDSSQATVSGWMNSAGHRANILDDRLKDVGFGIINIPSYQGKSEQTLVVAMYADPVAGMHTAPETRAENFSTADTKNISHIQSLTQGYAPWSSFVIGLFIGVLGTYQVIKHARGLKRVFRQGESFFVNHPVYDVALLSILVVAWMLIRTAGTIQ